MDDGLGERSLGSGEQVVYEGSVDFEELDREALQVAERRVAGAEVVDGEAYAHAVKVLEGCACAVGVGHKWFSCHFRGSIAAGESGWVCSEGEHRERDEWFVSVEPERDAGKESDLGVGGFDKSLREAGIECNVDRLAVRADPALQLHERWDPGAAGPAGPLVERDLAVVAFDREHVPQSFFE
jgi:hypothetical protein